MNVIKTEIPDVLIFEPKVFGDERGFFMESFNQKVFEEAVGRKVEFVQDNHSKSTKGVIRGLHFQLPPYSQAKLVRCVVGEVYDVVVDILSLIHISRQLAAGFIEENACHLKNSPDAPS